MAKTIGNPLTWTVQNARHTGEHFSASLGSVGSEGNWAMPEIRKLEFSDLAGALGAGFEDFAAARADVIFIALIYPIAGLLLVTLGLSMDLLPLVVPLILGFALLGPVAAIGVYEMSRRREAGDNPDWLDAFGVIRSPSIGAIVVLGGYLAGLFIAWIVAANMIYALTLGPEPPTSIMQFIRDVFTTGAGWAMILFGTLIGGLFAFAALATSLVSFPLLLDRKVGLPVAVVTSYRVLRTSPVVALSLGAIVGALLALGSVPMLLGLIVVVPVLGHATWHLYRRAVI